MSKLLDLPSRCSFYCCSLVHQGWTGTGWTCWRWAEVGGSRRWCATDCRQIHCRAGSAFGEYQKWVHCWPWQLLAPNIACLYPRPHQDRKKESNWKGCRKPIEGGLVKLDPSTRTANCRWQPTGQTFDYKQYHWHSNPLSGKREWSVIFHPVDCFKRFRSDFLFTMSRDEWATDQLVMKTVDHFPVSTPHPQHYRGFGWWYVFVVLETMWWHFIHDLTLITKINWQSIDEDLSLAVFVCQLYLLALNCFFVGTKSRK